MATRKIKVPAPRGRDPETRRFNRQLAVVAREKCPPEIMIDWLLAILAGHADATIEQDEDSGVWGIYRPEHGHASTPEHKQWAWTQLRQAGYGMPAQHHVIEGEIRQHITAAPVLDLGAISPAKLHAARIALLGAGTPGPEIQEPGSREPRAASAARDLDAVDAEFTELGPGDGPAIDAQEERGSSGQGASGDRMSESDARASANE